MSMTKTKWIYVGAAILAVVIVFCYLVRHAYGADGSVVFQSNTTRQFKLTDAAVATGNGQWIDTQAYREGIFDCRGITTATVQLQGSNAVALPTNATAGYVMAQWTNNGAFPIPYSYGATAPTLEAGVTAATATALDIEMPRFVKMTVTAWTSGTITCVMVGRVGPTL